MGFELANWKEKTVEGWQKASGRLAQWKTQDAPYLLYGTLCGLSLWPLVEAYQSGQTLPAMMALGSVAAGVGGNLLAEQVQRWKDGADSKQVTKWVVEQVPDNPELRDALDAILEQLELIQQAPQGLAESDRQWFTQTLQSELSQLGNLARFERALAWGAGSKVVTGGVLVEGNVKGDLVTGTKNTTFDMRGQKVRQQYNIDGDWKGQDLPKDEDD